MRPVWRRRGRGPSAENGPGIEQPAQRERLEGEGKFGGTGDTVVAQGLNRQKESRQSKHRPKSEKSRNILQKQRKAWQKSIGSWLRRVGALRLGEAEEDIRWRAGGLTITHEPVGIWLTQREGKGDP